MELNHSHGISLMGENHVKPPFFTSGLFIYLLLLFIIYLFSVGLDTVFTPLRFFFWHAFKKIV